MKTYKNFESDFEKAKADIVSTAWDKERIYT